MEYQDWYQILRPIGSFPNEQSRIEVLKLADESELWLREKVKAARSQLIATSTDESSLEFQSPSVQEVVINRNLKKRSDSETYLSPNLKNFQDQEEEIKSIFWNLLKTVDPECPADIDVAAIRAFLKRREEELGKKDVDESEEDVFDKYRLGIHSKPMPIDGDSDGRVSRDLGTDSLIAMIDKMVEERTKPITDQKDMYDKNLPITGKVGFRRDELNGPREYTDLDEQLDFGNLGSEVDFRKLLVQKGMGRFDSKGNFTSLESEADKLKESRKGVKVGQKKSGWKKGDKKDHEGSSDDDEGRRDGRPKSKTGRLQTASEMERRLEDLKKTRRYPEWDFPMCNYPKWVHRMYRMDQEKIGQLIKQGMDVPEYCPPWMMNVLDNVWGAKDASTRGEKPSNLQRKKLKGHESDSTTGDGGGKREKETQDQTGRTSQTIKLDKEGYNTQDNDGTFQVEGGGHTGGLEDGGSKTSFDVGDFLQGYDKEMLDLAKLEANTDSGDEKRHLNDDFDIEDLMQEYENHLQREEGLLNDSKNRKEIKEKAMLDKLKERQAAIRNKMSDRVNKQLQDEKMKSLRHEETNIDKEQEEYGQERGVSGRIPRRGSTMRRRKSKKSKKIVLADIEPCGEFMTQPVNPAKDEECMNRFKVLLQGQNKIMKENEFIEIAKKISLLKYDNVKLPKTPCDRAGRPICD